MKDFKKYNKELCDYKTKIVEQYGDEITNALISKYLTDEHRMEVEDAKHFYSEEYSELTKELEKDFAPVQECDFEKYEKEIAKVGEPI